MPHERTAVITGLGPVSALGIGKDNFLTNLYAAESKSRFCDLFDVTHCHGKCVADILDFDPSDFISTNRIKRFDRFSQLALASAKLALHDAELSPPEDSSRWAISFGSAIAGFAGAEADHESFLQNGREGISLPLPFRILGSSAASQMAIELGIHGPCTSNSDSCAAGNSAIGRALQMIRYNEADVVLAGAAEAPLAALTFTALDRLKVLSARGKITPFAEGRDGFVLAEGAATLLIEEKQHALKRGAHIYCELSGYGASNEAYHMTTPEPSGRAILSSMKQALESSQISPQDVDLISTHGSGTIQNDRNEASSIQTLCRDTPPLCIATKASTGHCLGAVSALEAVICVGSMEKQSIPPSVNTSPLAADSTIPLSENAQHYSLNVVLSNAFGFGGIDTALVFKKLAEA